MTFRRTRRTALALALVGTVAAASPASGAVNDRLVSNESTRLHGFDQLNASLGTLKSSGARAYDGRRSVQAHVRGGGNGYSRGIFNVDWSDGDDVYYGVALYLPRGFHRSMQGQVDLLRWDNWETDPTRTDRSGIVIWRGDRRARLVRQKLGVEEVTISKTFRIPEGRWVWLEVHQRLSRGSGALNEVFLNGRRLSRTRNANTYGRGVQRLRAGIVAMDASRQKRPLKLWFDRVSVRSGSALGVRR